MILAPNYIDKNIIHHLYYFTNKQTDILKMKIKSK